MKRQEQKSTKKLILNKEVVRNIKTDIKAGQPTPPIRYTAINCQPVSSF
jgi:hypothetical protein